EKAAQVLLHLDPVPGHLEAVALQLEHGELHVHFRVLDEQDTDRRARGVPVRHQFAPSGNVSISSGASVKKNAAPLPGAASAQIRPPWRWTMRCTVASPMPVPGNSSVLCRRWNAPNSLSA